MNDKPEDSKTPEVSDGRRRVLKASALALATAGAYGVAPFFGPWKHNHAWSQAAQKKPLVIGLTMDASGQYAASGMDERLGAMMAIKEINAKGGVLGRPIEAIHMDTETTPATGSRVAERLITRNEAAFLIGALHSGVANAISQVAQKYGCIYPQHQFELADRGGQGLPPRQVRLGRQRHELRARDRQERDGGQRQELGAADQRLRVGAPDVEGDAHDRRGERRQDRRGADGAAEHARLLVVPPQDPADQAERGRRRHRRRRHQGAAPAGRAGQAQQERRRGSTTSRTGRTCTASGPTRSSACSAPTGTTGSICPGVKEFVAAYQTTYPGVQIRVPGNTYYNGYMATRELLRAVERAGTTNNIKVIKELEGAQGVARATGCRTSTPT